MTEHFCQTHSCKFYRNEKEGKVWYSHKIKDGGYCNEPKEEIETKPKPQEQSATVTETESPGDKWIEKDRITRKSIERQTSLNAAVELAKAMGVAPLTSGQVIATAKVFEAYLEGKEVQKNKLVEAAKKMGATEIKEGE